MFQMAASKRIADVTDGLLRIGVAKNQIFSADYREPPILFSNSGILVKLSVLFLPGPLFSPR